MNSNEEKKQYSHFNLLNNDETLGLYDFLSFFPSFFLFAI